MTTLLQPTSLSMARIVATWLPLAFSWLLMSLEGPLVSAVIARLAEPKINLAAFNIVFALSMIVESPIIMLLSASTALSTDWLSFKRIRRFMHVTSAILTGLHGLIALTPLYDLVVRQIFNAPEAIIEPARMGLIFMLPWTWSIAFRRFHQGVLIRFGMSRAVGAGTIIRLCANGLTLAIGYHLHSLPGIVVATSAMSVGVICEAIYTGIVVRPVLARELKLALPNKPPLTWNAFFIFYIPLVMTSLLALLVNPIGTASISRMPQALDSLAVWPVITGLVFLFRGIGIGYNEVVVALLDQPGASARLQQFAGFLAIATSAMLLLMAATPLSEVWFRRISALSPDLVDLAVHGLWLMVPIPALNVLQSWYQGSLLFHRRTKAITESVVLYLIICTGLLTVGVVLGNVAGLYIGLGATGIAMLIQTIWLGARSQRGYTPSGG